jgi:hypothetical protein
VRLLLPEIHIRPLRSAGYPPGFFDGLRMSSARPNIPSEAA